MPIAEYSLKDFITFLLATYGVIISLQGIHNVIRNWYSKKHKKDNADDDNVETIKKMAEDISALRSEMSNINNNVKTLMGSDREDIKAFIAKEHNYFVIQKRAIDADSLEAIKKRFEFYTQEHGNGFVTRLMADIDSLPIVSKEELNER